MRCRAVARLLAYSEAACLDRLQSRPAFGHHRWQPDPAAGQHLLNLFVWFDNEWGFANRMLDVAWLPLVALERWGHNDFTSFYFLQDFKQETP
jgi:hypothetical protein